MDHQQDGRAAGSVDPVDLARFDDLGDRWWDPSGPMGKLHEINPIRLRYLKDILGSHGASRHERSAAAPFGGLRFLDIGCGGGLLCEPLARLGAQVTGIDPAGNSIAAARRHCSRMGLTVDYRATTAEALAAQGEHFDVVLAMEVVEHVPDREDFVATVCSLVKPGGLLIASTLNRTAKSFLLAIVGAEYLLRWLPRGTHRWSQFVTPDEFASSVRQAGLHVLDRTGLVYDPLRRDWLLSRDTDVNYILAARRP